MAGNPFVIIFRKESDIMKVLFLSNTAGQGHNATASALMGMLTEQGVECKMLDTYAYISPVLYEGLSRGYLLSTSIVPIAYGRFYRLAEKKEKNDRKYSVTNIANSIMSIKLKKYMNDFNADVIVCTHIFSAQLVNVMKIRGQIKSIAIGIITDFTIHPFWQDVDHIDYFVTASELLTCQAVKKGIPESKILPFGIPIATKFSKSIDKHEARKQLGIDPDTFTILLMSGSMGHGNILKILSNMDGVDNNFQVLVVCGNNKRVKRKIDKMKTNKKVYSYGYVNNVEVMMDAADCIVSKPGGLTTSEALAKYLPMIMVDPIPGQEDRNVEFMLNNGLAMKLTSTFTIDEVLYQLFLYPQKLLNMESNIRLVGKCNASRDLCNFITHLEKKVEIKDSTDISIEK
jgi:processive 1,2-diacylglycerol beta-glucosyltransferase